MYKDNPKEKIDAILAHFGDVMASKTEVYEAEFAINKKGYDPIIVSVRGKPTE